MKCEKCGNEANFFYSSTVNGQHEEHCYCAKCAEEAGLENAFADDTMQVFGEMLGGLFGGMLMPARVLSAFDGFGGPIRDMLAVPDRTAFPRRALSEAEAKIPGDAGAEVRARREAEALRRQLQEAVEGEDFEKAIELRDRLRAMEGTE
ncbi:MAG: UvrB/UvrC motif-containing protein [Oscillospiraceae bacterium]|nr:UvrB/UvrC motif-containing protein [Oscillospiraceae bacterium]